jgi:hypothetical protein
MPSGRVAEYLVPAEDHGDHKQQSGERRHSDGCDDKHQAAGENSPRQQPDCYQDNRKDSAEPEHKQTPLAS